MEEGCKLQWLQGFLQYFSRRGEFSQPTQTCFSVKLTAFQVVFQKRKKAEVGRVWLRGDVSVPLDTKSFWGVLCPAHPAADKQLKAALAQGHHHQALDTSRVGQTNWVLSALLGSGQRGGEREKLLWGTGTDLAGCGTEHHGLGSSCAGTATIHVEQKSSEGDTDQVQHF